MNEIAIYLLNDRFVTPYYSSYPEDDGGWEHSRKGEG